MKYTKGLTLIELMIVLAIIGATMSLGWAGLSYFRRTQQVQTEAENLREFLRSLRSKATTSSLDSSGHWIYGYRLDIDSDGNKYTLYKLTRGDPGVPGQYEIDDFWNSQWGSVGCPSGNTCELVESYSPLSDTDLNTSCSKIGFSSVNGFVRRNSSPCIVTFSALGLTRSVEVTDSGDILITE